MASDEVLDRDLLFRKMKTKPDNKVLLPVACLSRPLLLLYADESCILVICAGADPVSQDGRVVHFAWSWCEQSSLD